MYRRPCSARACAASPRGCGHGHMSTFVSGRRKRRRHNHRYTERDTIKVTQWKETQAHADRDTEIQGLRQTETQTDRERERERETWRHVSVFLSSRHNGQAHTKMCFLNKVKSLLTYELLWCKTCGLTIIRRKVLCHRFIGTPFVRALSRWDRGRKYECEAFTDLTRYGVAMISRRIQNICVFAECWSLL